MRCNRCGLDQSALASFCFSCGQSLLRVREKQLMDFNSFFESKKKQRTSTTKTKKPTSDKMTVNGSLLKANLKQDRGTSTPVIVEKSFGPYELKRVIYEKVSRYHTHVSDFDRIEYKLVYKTGDTIKYIPGTEIPFTVENTKQI